MITKIVSIDAIANIIHDRVLLHYYYDHNKNNKAKKNLHITRFIITTQ